MVDLSAIAGVTGRLSGAELEFIVNEAAIRAVRRVSAALRQGNVDASQICSTVRTRGYTCSVSSGMHKARQRYPRLLAWRYRYP